MAKTKTILITGANGGIGRKLQHYFSELNYDMRLIDRSPGRGKAGRKVLIADLSQYHETWAKQFAEVDTVIHLAADPQQDATWDSIYPNNVLATQNVVSAARRNGTGRIVFASSNWVLAGYRFEEPYELNSQLLPKPTNNYAISKLIGEQIGTAIADDVSFIAFRIGASVTRFDRLSNYAPWAQQMWVSDRDLCHAMERAVVVKHVKYAVLNLMSDNWRSPGLKMRWNIEETKAAIGYAPRDSGTVIESEMALQKDREAKRNDRQWKKYSHLCAQV